MWSFQPTKLFLFLCEILDQSDKSATVGIVRYICVNFFELGNNNSPASVAQVTSHRTISLLRQFSVDSVILITYNETQDELWIGAKWNRIGKWCLLCLLALFTWRPSSRDTLSSVMSGRLSMRVAILKASWASLKMCDAEWMFFWMDSNTVSSLRASPGETAHKQDRQPMSLSSIEPHFFFPQHDFFFFLRIWDLTGFSKKSVMLRKELTGFPHTMEICFCFNVSGFSSQFFCSV